MLEEEAGSTRYRQGRLIWSQAARLFINALAQLALWLGRPPVWFCVNRMPSACVVIFSLLYVVFDDFSVGHTPGSRTLVNWPNVTPWLLKPNRGGPVR